MRQRSAFFHFKPYFCQEQKKKGIYYANNAQLEAAAYPVWLEMSPNVRLVVKDLVSGRVTKSELREQRKVKHIEKRTIKQFIRSRLNENTMLDVGIYLIDVNCYCMTTAGRHLVGEFCLVQFNLRNGVQSHYHSHINPGKVPLGYGNEVKYNTKHFGLKPIDEDAERDDRSLLHDIKTFVHFSKKCMLFTEAGKVAAVKDFLREVTTNAGEDPAQFLVFKADYLLYVLFKSVTDRWDKLSKKEASRQLGKERFMLYPGLSCGYHHAEDKLGCTVPRAKSWAFTILEICCPIVGIEIESGKHAPPLHRRDIMAPSFSSACVAPSNSACAASSNSACAAPSNSACAASSSSACAASSSSACAASSSSACAASSSSVCASSSSPTYAAFSSLAEYTELVGRSAHPVYHSSDSDDFDVTEELCKLKLKN